MSTIVTCEIPRDEWVSFFNAFSRRHDEWLATVEVLGDDLGAQIEARSLRFVGINADLKDGQDVITIGLGETVESAITHSIRHPIRLWQGQSVTESSAFETLEIESADGLKTLVRFHSELVPDVA